jgi:hypothetical protein
MNLTSDSLKTKCIYVPEYWNLGFRCFGDPKNPNLNFK